MYKQSKQSLNASKEFGEKLNHALPTFPASSRCTLRPDLVGTVKGVDHDTVSCQNGSV